jgi:hypothetical protein
MLAEPDQIKQNLLNIVTLEDLNANLEMNCVPDNMNEMDAGQFTVFLAKRRILMAKKIKFWFNSL